jgi:hypothetical protein
MADFPTSVTTNGDPTSSNTLANVPHAQQHQSHNAEIKATQTKLGTGASTPTSGKVLRSTGTGSSAWGQLDLTTDLASFTSAALRAVITDETGSGAAVFGTSPTIATPAVTGGTFASPALTTPSVVTSINDANGNEVIKTPATASAVNEVTVTNAVTGSDPSIAPSGNDTNINLNLRGKGLAKSVTVGAGAAPIYQFDFVLSGCVITADAAGSTLNWSMTAGVVVINGNPISVAALSAQVATGSRDTYVDVLDSGSGTGTVVVTGGNIVTNNAVSPALASNSIRIGIIVTGATTIATTASINQGQEDRILPIVSSVPYAVTDSLGNLICPRDKERKLLGYRQIITNATATTIAQVTGLSCPVIVPANRKIEIEVVGSDFFASVNAIVTVTIWDGVVGSGTQKARGLLNNGGTVATTVPAFAKAVTTPATSSKTYNVGLASSAGTATVEATVLYPFYIKVNLV